MEIKMPAALKESLQNKIKNGEVTTAEEAKAAMVEIINKQAELVGKILADNYRGEQARECLWNIFNQEMK